MKIHHREVILLVFDAPYTEQENGCQATHEQETQNVVLLLQGVHVFITVPLRNPWQQETVKHTHVVKLREIRKKAR